MDTRKLRPNPEYYEQLALELDISDEDRAQGGYVSPEEAQRRSVLAKQTLGLQGQELAPEWFDQYAQLMAAGWPWRVACYIAWCASPKRGRWPRTQQELAIEVLGLTSDRQIATWRKKNPNIDELIAVLQALPLMEYRGDAFKALGVSAGDPDHRHNPDRKLLFEMTGDYQPKLKLDGSLRGDDDDLLSMSDDELDAIRKRANKSDRLGSEDDGEA